VSAAFFAYAITPSQQLTPADVRRMASPPLLNTKAVAVGVGYSSGALGVEWIDRRTLRWTTAVGVGAMGVGARVVWHPWLVAGRGTSWTPYIGPGFNLVPWRVSRFDGAGLVGGELGVQRWGADGEWFADLGAGAAVVARGTWRGEHVVPVLRVAFGRGKPY
jgi:hypothetical protein